MLSAPIAVFILMRLFHINEWNFFLFLAVVLGTAAVAVWGTAKVLGVHLSRGSWSWGRSAWARTSARTASVGWPATC